MKTTTKNTGIKVSTGVKGGGITPNTINHNRLGLKVRASVKAGSLIRFSNHNTRLLTVA